MNDQRLRDLEVSVAVQEEILTSIQAELIEAGRLNDSVERLGEGANVLGAALLQVDRNQRELTRLDRYVQKVEEKAATTQDVESRVRQAKVEADLLVKAAAARVLKERKRWAKKVGAVIAVIGLVLFGLVFYVSNSAHDACGNRQMATKAVLDTLLSFRSPQNADRVDAGALRIQATLAVTCDEQYRLHL